MSKTYTITMTIAEGGQGTVNKAMTCDSSLTLGGFDPEREMELIQHNMRGMVAKMVGTLAFEREHAS